MHITMLMFFCAVALRIHMSTEAHSALSEFSGYVTEPRGLTAVKVRRCQVRVSC
jgi:hypothetical protein